MKNNVLGLATVLAFGTALATTPAKADNMDMPSGVYDWSGSYFGIKLGGGFGEGRIGNPAAGLTEAFNIDGFIGGIMSGYSFQMGNLVFGLDSDLSFADVDGRSSDPICVPGACRVELQMLSTTRLRAGFAMDRFLPYITGGFASGLVDANVGSLGGKSKFHYGFAAGGGLEYAFMDGWHARVEYLFIDLDKRSHRFGGASGRVSVNDMHVIRAGISMKTGWIWDAILGR